MNASADFPSIVFMRYTWDTQSQHHFRSIGQRTRYLTADFFINPPHPLTPLYHVQYIPNERHAMYETSSDSLVILATHATLYLLTSRQAMEVIGKWRQKKGRACPDPWRRLGTAQYLWTRQSTSAPTWNGDDDTLEQRLAPFQLNSLEALYDRVVGICKRGGIEAATNAGHLQEQMPRPERPELGIPLGTSIEVRDCSGVSPSARPRGQFGTRERMNVGQ